MESGSFFHQPLPSRPIPLRYSPTLESVPVTVAPPLEVLLIRDGKDGLDVVWHQLGNSMVAHLFHLLIDPSRDCKEDVSGWLQTRSYTNVLLPGELGLVDLVKEHHQGPVIGYGGSTNGIAVEKYDCFVVYDSTGKVSPFNSFMTQLGEYIAFK